MSLCQKVLGKDHPFFGRKCFFRFKFSLNKPNFIRKINLTPKVSSEFVKYENLHQVRAENRQRKGGHFGCTASVVVLFPSFFFRQFSFCCLTGQSQSFLMLVKMATCKTTTCKICIIEINICLFRSKCIGSGSDADENVRMLLFTADLWSVKQRSCC